MNKLEVTIEEVKKLHINDSKNELYELVIDEDQDIINLTGVTTSKNAFLDIKERLKNFIEVNNFVNLVPEFNSTNRIYGVCNVSVGNIRAIPDHSAELSSQILLGHPVLILMNEDGWLRVQTGDNYIGWINKESIISMDRAEFKEWTLNPKVIITNPFCFSYKEIGVDSPVISNLTAGNILKLSSSSLDKHHEIEYPDGRKAMVLKENTRDFEEWKSSLDLNGTNIIQLANQFIGIPYLWGGSTYKGVDCSGFTQFIYFFNGGRLPRDASQQFRKGVFIDSIGNFSAMEKGDLIFFGRREKDKIKINHVGISLGQSKFIHASGEGMVKVNSLDSTKPDFSLKEYKKYIAAKRYLNIRNHNVNDSVDINFFKNFIYE
ncbi:C40 family peptidase [Wocania ichthyoenteri]|uniref:C40 family peptidase n=1 Tax=Wocania ichthyoenteri TaxID=1230531 RepID=UPI00138DDA05|nr:C40 family peptidase [Wocania ichthyoenteri]